MAERLSVDVTFSDARWRNAVPDPVATIEAVLSMVWTRESDAQPPSPREGVEVAVVFLGDCEISALNARYRGKDAATNVLAFPGLKRDAVPPGEAWGLGDIVLSVETAGREAAAEDKSLADHLCHLLVHGMLHLLGYDHQDDTAAREMETRERALLAELGIADPYGTAGQHDIDER